MEKFQITIGDKNLEVQFKNLAEKANGCCLVKYGDTMVLATAVMSNQPREGIDFLPLTVEYEERFYAAGKILGSRFMRREGRPSDEAMITARAIDRSIRPRFPNGLRREVQVVVTCLSWDTENDPDVIGLLAASIALSVSDIPWAGPLAALRVGKKNQDFILNPTYEERGGNKELDILLAGIEKEDFLLNMIEMEGEQAIEETITSAYEFALPELKKLITFQKEIVEKTGKKKIILEEPQKEPELEKDMSDFLKERLEKAIYSEGPDRASSRNNLKEDLVCFIERKHPGKGNYAKNFLESETEKIIHKNIIEHEKRPDGRKLDQIRNIQVEAGLLPRTHGSGLFMRGETKALSILTLGAPSDVRLLEGMEIRGKKRFMHHYNFPPYCSGEVKPMRGPGRREIGHGMLAEKALMGLVPNFDDFPYTMRTVTEILSSNGSTSMAAVSATSLALMDAGVPIKEPVTGIAIGLMSNEKGEYKLLADIQGPEDHHGDMDFKVAGTRKGITAIQMDVKIDGINGKILKEALELGQKSRHHILDKMAEVLPKTRPELSRWAPRIYTLQIKPEKIREVIGPGGKVIHEIIEKCEVGIDIEDSGKVFITAEKEEAGQKALAWIKNITKEVKVGEIFEGKVKRILNFGAFVEILPGQEGLVHISQLAPRHVEKVEDVVNIGDVVPVKVVSIDEQGRINLSIKEIKK